VTELDFSDPVWLRLGFVNEVRYNWTADTDVQRAQRDRRFGMGWRRWHLAMLGVVVRLRTRHVILPVILIVLALLVIAIDDASFLGGVRPYDGGDDGLFYDGVGRIILQKLLARDIWSALEGGEKVFYYGGPGLRYFRALEHIVFGESYLGYLSLILLLPFLAYGLFRRFLPEIWSLTLILLFVAIPLGMLFGSSFAH